MIEIQGEFDSLEWNRIRPANQNFGHTSPRSNNNGYNTTSSSSGFPNGDSIQTCLSSCSIAYEQHFHPKTAHNHQLESAFFD
jgi:hypothetical protein